MNASVAALALGIPHEVRLKLAKRMRAEQLRRYNEREKKQQLLVLQESDHGESALIKQRGDKSQSRGVQEIIGRSLRVVGFQAKDVLMDAAQNGDTEEGKPLAYHNAQCSFASFGNINAL